MLSLRSTRAMSIDQPPLIRDELLEQWQWKMDGAAKPNKSAPRAPAAAAPEQPPKTAAAAGSVAPSRAEQRRCQMGVGFVGVAWPADDASLAQAKAHARAREQSMLAAEAALEQDAKKRRLRERARRSAQREAAESSVAQRRRDLDARNESARQQLLENRLAQQRRATEQKARMLEQKAERAAVRPEPRERDAPRDAARAAQKPKEKQPSKPDAPPPPPPEQQEQQPPQPSKPPPPPQQRRPRPQQQLQQRRPPAGVATRASPARGSRAEEPRASAKKIAPRSKDAAAQDYVKLSQELARTEKALERVRRSATVGTARASAGGPQRTPPRPAAKSDKPARMPERSAPKARKDGRAADGSTTPVRARKPSSAPSAAAAPAAAAAGAETDPPAPAVPPAPAAPPAGGEDDAKDASATIDSDAKPIKTLDAAPQASAPGASSAGESTAGGDSTKTPADTPVVHQRLDELQCLSHAIADIKDKVEALEAAEMASAVEPTAAPPATPPPGSLEAAAGNGAYDAAAAAAATADQIAVALDSAQTMMTRLGIVRKELNQPPPSRGSNLKEAARAKAAPRQAHGQAAATTSRRVTTPRRDVRHPTDSQAKSRVGATSSATARGTTGRGLDKRPPVSSSPAKRPPSAPKPRTSKAPAELKPPSRESGGRARSRTRQTTIVMPSVNLTKGQSTTTAAKGKRVAGSGASKKVSLLDDRGAEKVMDVLGALESGTDDAAKGAVGSQEPPTAGTKPASLTLSDIEKLDDLAAQVLDSSAKPVVTDTSGAVPPPLVAPPGAADDDELRIRVHELTNTVNELQGQIETYRGSGTRESSATSGDGAEKSADVEQPRWKSVAPAEPAVLAESNDKAEPAGTLEETTERKPLPTPPSQDAPPPLPQPLDTEVSSDLQAAAERMSAPLASPQGVRTSPLKPQQGEVLPPPALGSAEIDGIERPSAESVGEQLSGQLAEFDSSVADELRALRDIATSLRSVGSEPEKPAGSEPEKPDPNGAGNVTSEGT